MLDGNARRLAELAASVAVAAVPSTRRKKKKVMAIHTPNFYLVIYSFFTFIAFST